MLVTGATRSQALEFLGGSPPPLYTRSVGSVRELLSFHDDFVVGWSDERLRQGWYFPSLMVSNRRPIRDLLAWVSTYLTAAVPLSALCRVMDREALAVVTRRGPGAIDERAARILAAVVLGEASSLTSGGAGPQPPAAWHTHTFSYVAAQLLMQGAPMREIYQAHERWEYARHLTRQSPRALGSEVLLQIWELVFALVHGGMGDTGTKDPNFVSELRSKLGELNSWRPVTSSRREDRVDALREALRSAAEPTTEPFRAAFNLAFQASLLAPGELEFLPVLKNAGSLSALATVLYFVCAALPESSKLLTHARGARRVLRDVLDFPDMLTPPHCDVSFDEFLSLAEGTKPDFESIGAGSIQIEISPGVLGTIRLPSTRPASHQVSLSLSVPPTSPPEGNFDPQKVREALNSVQKAQELLSLALGVGPVEVRPSGKPTTGRKKR